jgi:hypothetical protein
MTKKDILKAPPLSVGDETTKQIEETAYYSWLNRIRYAQVGDQLDDWIEAEKEVRSYPPS